MSNLLKDASILLTPTAYDNGKMLSIKPEDGDGDFTFLRNTAATRVNAQGLVENVQILSSNKVQNGDFSEEGAEQVSNGSFSEQGAELITNGDFSNGLTNWSVNGGSYATIVSGALNSNNPDAGNWYAKNISQNVSFVNGITYKLTFKAKNISGGLNLRITQGATEMASLNLTSTFVDYTYFYTANADNGSIRIFCNGVVGQFQIDNISVKEVGQDWSLGTGWSIGDDKAISDGSVVGNSYLISTGNTLTIGKTYKVQYTILDYIQGNVRVRAGQASSIFVSADGTYTEYMVATSTESVRVQANSNFNGSITNISVKEVGQDWIIEDTWTIGNSVANGNGANGGSEELRQTSVVSVGKEYKATWEIKNYVSGSLAMHRGSGNPLIYRSGNEVFTEYWTATSSPVKFRGINFIGDLTNIVIKEVTNDTDLPRINYEGFSYQDALGSEEVVNGDFSDGLNGWTSHAGSTLELENGMAKVTTVVSQGFIRRTDLSIETGKTYFCKAYITNALSPQWYINSVNNPINLSLISENTYGGYVTTTGNNSFFYIRGNGTNGEVSYIDNVSVKEYLGQEVVPDSGCGSWLLENESTNLVPYSSDFSSLNAVANAVVTSNQIISPSGLLDADEITFDGTLYGRVEASLSVTNGATYTISVYLKNKDLSDVTQVWIGFAQIGQGQFITITDEWQRYEITLAANGTTEYPRIQFSGTGSLYAWGFQTEQQSYATSYIPTSDASSTRNRDLASGSGNSTLINSTEGVLYAEIAALADSGTFRLIGFSDGTIDNRVYIGYSSSNKITCSFQVDTFEQYGFSFAKDITINSKLALKYKENDFALWIDGVEVDSQLLSGNTLPIGTLTQMQFTSGTTSSHFFGKVKALAVYKEALTDAELTALTTI